MLSSEMNAEEKSTIAEANDYFRQTQHFLLLQRRGERRATINEEVGGVYGVGLL